MNKKLKIQLVPLAVTIMAVCLVLWVGLYIGQNFYTPELKPEQEKHQGGYKYIDPLLECNNYQPSGPAYYEMERDLHQIVDSASTDKKIKTVSVYFRDLNNGPWLGINEKEKFSPASLLKVPLMIAYLKLAEDQPVILQKKLTVKNHRENILSQNITPLAQVTVGQEYAVIDLLGYMIKYSDNAAANTLLENLPPEDLSRTYTDLKLQIPGEGGTENFMTVVDYASFFRILYNSSYLNRTMSEKALEILTTSAFTKGLTAGLPDTIEVAHKFGERKIGEEKQLHDCGIIYLKNNNYLLCVMTRGNDFETMEKTIASISKQVFAAINKFTNR